MLNFIRTGLEEKKAGAQMNRARKKMVQDLHHRSMIRVAPEEFNLAANYHPQDVTNAEFTRTYRSKVFPGGKLAQRLDVEKNKSARSGRYILRSLVGETDSREIHVKFFEDAYGYRGRDSRVYYLSPWEFLMCSIYLSLFTGTRHVHSVGPPSKKMNQQRRKHPPKRLQAVKKYKRAPEKL